jgi:hypothetical protein
MSGYSVEDIARSIQEVIRMPFLPKPFQFVDLLTVLQHIFSVADISYELGR